MRGRPDPAARVLRGDTHHPGKVVSVFEPHRQITRKGKRVKPTEFGRLVKIQEAEGQLITDHVACAPGHTDRDLWVPALERHAALFGDPPARGGRRRVCLADERTLGAGPWGAPRRVAAAAERPPIARGAGGPAVADRQRRTHRALKRCHGLPRCRYRGEAGMQRWVGLGVIAKSFTAIARARTR